MTTKLQRNPSFPVRPVPQFLISTWFPSLPSYASHSLPTSFTYSQHHPCKASIALHSAIRSRFPPPKSFLFLSEWLVLVLPLLLSVTLFADRPGTLSTALLLPTAFLCFFFPPHESGTPLPSGGVVSPLPSPTRLHPAPRFQRDKRSQQNVVPAEDFKATHLSALSTYRAHMMLMTILSILAVDFPVFPRALAKCETYGVSLVGPSFLLFVPISLP